MVRFGPATSQGCDTGGDPLERAVFVGPLVGCPPPSRSLSPQPSLLSPSLNKHPLSLSLCLSPSRSHARACYPVSPSSPPESLSPLPLPPPSLPPSPLPPLVLTATSARSRFLSTPLPPRPPPPFHPCPLPPSPFPLHAWQAALLRMGPPASLKLACSISRRQPRRPCTT